MPVLAILIIGIQVFFAVHAVRSGKETFWLYLIIMAPGIGCAIYFFTQFLPEATNSRGVEQTRSKLVHAIDPQRELRKRMDLLTVADTIENRLALAHECVEENMSAEAINVLEEGLVGMHATDPAIMQLLATAHFDNGDPASCAKVLNELIAANPDFQSADGHLLYARALEAQNKTEEAGREYDVLRASYPGEEARVRYALMCSETGDNNLAMELFEESIARAKRAPRHYAKKEKHWLDIAKKRGKAVTG